MDATMLEARQLSKRYGKVQALSDVSLEVQSGEIFGIIGPDGAGKTTLFRILTTLLKPDTGSATLNGLDIIKDFRKIRTQVGYMPGRFSLYQDLTVEENLSFFASVFGTTIQQNYHLIKDIYQQIEPFRDRRAGALSGGMKQKLALCCALIHKPTVLFLDEPTTGVDPVSRRDLWEMLRALKSQGMTILVSTPYMNEAGLCDRIALVLKGRFLKVDPPSVIVGQYQRRLLSVRAQQMFRLLKDLRAHPQVKSCFAFGDTHHVACDSQDLSVEQLRSFLEARGHRELEIGPIQPGIEDCFMELAYLEESP